MKPIYSVLVIEDESPIREIIQEFLEDAEFANFTVMTAEDGQGGLDLAYQAAPDLILCDIMMPRLDGYEVLARLRQHLPTALTPFIFLSAKVEAPNIRQGMVLGADDYLTKPFTRQDLLDAIRVRLQRQQRLQQFVSRFHGVEASPSGPSQLSPHTSEQALIQALEHREFQLYYQPQICLKTGALVGAEALIRWHSPSRGIVPPSDFIPLAEATGFIIPLGAWVLQAACEQLKAWQEAGLPPLTVSINLSSAQFNQPNLIDHIAATVTRSGITPQQLGLELTESLLVKDVNATIERLQQLRRLNVHVAIDDFGTGYASLGYLQHFPFDSLKIDRCFIRSIHQNRTNAAITTAVIDMAHQLGLSVTAEGVETEDECAFLQVHGCDFIQGFLISRPLPVEEFGHFQAHYSALPPPLSPEVLDACGLA